MRFTIGPVPKDPDFTPEDHGWRAIREPGPWTLQAIALPLVVGLCAAIVAWMHACTAIDLDASVPAWWLLAILPLIPAHELLHALCHPGAGLSGNTLFGLWPKKLVFYAH